MQIGTTIIQYSVYPFTMNAAHPLEIFKVITKYLLFSNVLSKNERAIQKMM